MKLKLASLIIILAIINSYAQIENLVTKFDLPNILEETSGLIFFNNKLISHNDSGGGANLYELDTITGQIDRTIQVTNATNEDWEDIAQDDDYIYIGDFGNNDGNRTDLKIYRIEKLDLLFGDTVTAEIINFSYEDQTDFSDNPQTNFDAEAMVIFNDDILIFTKNRDNFQTNAYIFSKEIGTHTAVKIGTYNVQGLITGATFNYADYSLFLSGYSYNNGLQPFLLYLSDFTDQAIFDGTVVKTSLTSIIGVDSQVEGITSLGNERYFLSRETRNGLPQRVYAFSSAYVLNVDDYFQTEIVIYPNPFQEYIKINASKEILKIEIFNSNGKIVHTKITDFSKINIASLNAGKYILKIFIGNEKPIIKKLIKF